MKIEKKVIPICDPAYSKIIETRYIAETQEEYVSLYDIMCDLVNKGFHTKLLQGMVIAVERIK